MRAFDLNIEKILDNWEVCHAIREVIANALDEQAITGTKDIEIKKSSDGAWHVIDFGRGLNYHHLTQNENAEKLENEHLIGHFGVGLKDALATFHRHDVKVTITSKFGVITLDELNKEGFDDLVTLHAKIEDPLNPNMVGTDFKLVGCSDDDVFKARRFFLRFSDESFLENTPYGDVLKKRYPNYSSIYVNGVRVAEEENFLFSYNITKINSKLRKAMNRERSNVGRSAYTDSIKSILLSCRGSETISSMANDLGNYAQDSIHDELSWNDVQMHAAKEFAKLKPDICFVSQDDYAKTSLIDDIHNSGSTLILIPAKLARKMNELNCHVDESQRLPTAMEFLEEQSRNFMPKIVSIDELTEKERKVYDRTERILALIGGKPSNVDKILISETLYENSLSLQDTVGLWQPKEQRILIKRDQLATIHDYAGTLIHECIHAMYDLDDVNREFETQLTKTIGNIAEIVISKDEQATGHR